MTLALPDLVHERMTARGTLDDGSLAVCLDGTADAEVRPLLASYFDALHVEAVRLGLKSVGIDLRTLEFMNSSCLKILVAWLAQLRDLDADKQYKVRIRSNPSLLWQRRSLAALSCFAVDQVTINT
jgi:hypothetical protein